VGDLSSFLSPQSIALIGASSGTEKIGGRLMASILRHGYEGRLYPVNPLRNEVHGIPTVSSVEALPEPVDLAIICIPANAVLDVVQQCAAKGVSNASIISAGFGESGAAGAALQARLKEIAGASGMRVAGPNTEGFFNLPAKTAATFSPAINLDDVPEGQGGRIAIIAQSGGLGFALYNRGRLSGLNFSCVVSVGNQMDLEVADYANFLLDDADTQVLLLFIEAIKSPDKFLALAQKAIALRKPLIVAKVGRSNAGRRAIVSHTGSLGGTEAAYDALFHRYGIIRANSPDEMLEIAAAFTRHKPLSGNRVAIISSSGGTAAWLTDLCEASGLELPEVDPVRQKELMEFIPSYGSAANPIDITGQGMRGLSRSLRIVNESSDFDAAMIVGSFAHEGRLRLEGEEISEIAGQSEKPLFLYSYTVASQKSQQLLAQWKLHHYESMEGCAKAIAASYRYRQRLAEISNRSDKRPADLPSKETTRRLLGEKAAILCEYEAKAILAAYGIRSPREILARNADEAFSAAAEIGWPVAIKVQSPQIPHKTEAGALRLGLKDEASLIAAFENVLAHARAYAPQAQIDGVLVQPVAKPGIELIAGVTNDPDVGPLVMCGTGGIYVEAFQDVHFALAPLTPSEADALLGRLKASKLLDGVRGKPAADRQAMVDLLVRLSHLAVDAADRIAEIDLNPVIAYPRGQGLALVDALILQKERAA